MRTLQFSVDKQRLTKNGDFSKIVRGSKGYLKCYFIFEDDDWKNHKVAAIFENSNDEYPVAVKHDGTCEVPNEVTDSKYFKIRLVGLKNETRIITNKILVSQEG